MIKTLIAASAAALFALPAVASAQTESRAYAALGYGQVDTQDATLGAVTARVGYKFLPYAGVEAEAGIGVEDEGFDVSIGGSSGVYELKHDVAAYAVAFLPLGDRFEAFARVGYGTTEIEASAFGVTPRGTGDSINYGAGASVFLDRYNGLRADWTRRDFQGDNAGEADAWTVSYIRRF